MSQRLQMLEKAISSGSTDPFVWYARAMELKSTGQLPDALRAYEEVASKFPDYVPTYLMAGQLAKELGDPNQARLWFERGLPVAERKGNAHARAELEAAVAELS